MKKSRTFFGLLLLTAFQLSPAFAQESSSVICRIQSVRQQVTFGDSLTIECAVVTSPGTLVTDPSLEQPSSAYDIQLSWQRHESLGQDRSTERYGYLVHSFALDTLRVGPFVIQATDQSGKQFSVSSNILQIPVISVLDSADTALKPNRDPMTIPAKGIPRWVFALVGAALLAMALAIILLKTKRTFTGPVAGKPVDEIEEILRIASLGLIEQGKYKELYFMISMALRGFMHRIMRFDAMYETTDEITRELKKSSYDESITGAITVILREADQVLFATYIPSHEQVSTVIERTVVPVRSVLDENRRRSEAAALETARAASVPGGQAVTPSASTSPGGENQ